MNVNSLPANDPDLTWSVEGVKVDGRPLVQVVVRHPPSDTVGFAVHKDERLARDKALVRLNSMRIDPGMWNR